MPKKKIILDEDAICQDYVNNNIGTDGLAAKYHVGKLKIRQILNSHNIMRKKRGGQSLNEEFVVKDWKIKKYPPIEGKHYIAVDRKNGYKTNDYENNGGFLTTHIRETYDVKIPSLYDRRMYYMRTGNYWWEQWFDIKLIDNEPVKKCPYCDWSTTDLKNMSGMFETHLKKIHHISKYDYLLEHPEDREYFKTQNPQTMLQMETDSNNFVTCKICGKKFKTLRRHLMLAHHMSKIDYIKKYDKDFISEDFRKHLSSMVQTTNENMTFHKNSKDENEIKNFLLKNGVESHSDRKILDGKEIDIFVPTYNIGIEYNGLKWHSEWFGMKSPHYHYDKLEHCNKKGIKLITIFEDEYHNHKNLVLSKLKHIFHLSCNPQKISGRKCEIREIYKIEAEDFLNKNHIQGFASSTLYLGAFYKGNLIGVMTFVSGDNNTWELNRFATDVKYICQGVGGKLFNYFIKNNEYKSIKSFADRRWTIDEKNNIYTKIGFKLDGYTRPSYSYYNESIDPYKRFHKFTLRKNKLLSKYPQLKGMTEKEMAKTLGYDRVWDCGLIRYVYKNPNFNENS